MSAEPSVSHVLDQIRQGDSVAEAAVFRRFVAQLIHLAEQHIHRRLASKFDADDVVQSAFRSFFRVNSEAKYSIDSWNELWMLLARITVRKCSRKQSEYYRAKRDVYRETSQLTDTRRSDVLDQLPADQPTPEQIVMFSDTLDDLMSNLDPTQQQMILLKLQHHTNDEISTIVGRTERTVYRVLSQVRDRLSRLENEI